MPRETPLGITAADSKRLKGSEWLRAVRARHWLHFLLLPAAGIEITLGLSGNLVPQARGVVIAFAVLSFGYLLNALADRDMDASSRKNPFAGELPVDFVPWAAVFIALVALAFAASGPTPVLVATSLAVTSGVVYSIGPRLKRLPVIGTLLNVVHFTPLLWVGLPAGGDPRGLTVLAVCFSCLLLQNQLLHEASDRDDDRRGAVMTTFLLLGRVKTGAVIAVFGGAFVAVMAYARMPVSFTGICAVMYVVVLPWAFVRVQASALASVRKWHRVATIATGAFVFVCLRSNLIC